MKTIFPPMLNPFNDKIGGDMEEEKGLALVLKKTLLTPKQHSEDDWLRTNIFYTTCNIGGEFVI